MHDIEIGPAPAGESCAQVGSADYDETSQRECDVFRRMLYRLFPVPEGVPVAYVTRTHPHDFGTYREVSIRYDDAHGAAVDFAFQVEIAVPDRWDAAAQYELAWYERNRAYRIAVRERRLQPSEVPPQFSGETPPSLPAGARLCELLAAYPL
jgi:hypothetical protein